MKLNNTNNRVATPFGDFQIDVDHLFDHVFGGRSANGETKSPVAWSPRVSVTESDTDYAMMVELPGVDPADVSIEMKDNRLEISGVKARGELPEGMTSIRDERPAGEFKRSFEFTQQVDADKISAEFKNGVLSIELPKSQTVLPRKIEIKVAE